jgi:hypothetical protein
VTAASCLMSIWTITLDPIDSPGMFVTRRHAITADGAVATADHTITETLGAARNAVPVGSVNIGRDQADDPVILESWI